MKSGPHFRHVATSEKGDEEGLAFRGQKPFLSTGDGSFHARAAERGLVCLRAEPFVSLNFNQPRVATTLDAKGLEQTVSRLMRISPPLPHRHREDQTSG